MKDENGKHVLVEQRSTVSVIVSRRHLRVRDLRAPEDRGQFKSFKPFNALRRFKSSNVQGSK